MCSSLFCKNKATQESAGAFFVVQVILAVSEAFQLSPPFGEITVISGLLEFSPEQVNALILARVNSPTYPIAGLILFSFWNLMTPAKVATPKYPVADSLR